MTIENILLTTLMILISIFLVYVLSSSLSRLIIGLFKTNGVEEEVVYS